jgi:ATP-dependent Lhr-like helicase
LFLATSEDSLLRAAALLDLWQSGYVEPVHAPPKPFHILAQQLLALVLQERGIGQRAWFEWVSGVPAFAQMDPARIEEAVQHLLMTRILWSDNGILSFAPEGEAEYGRKNFLELLSVFTSPPLFRVLSGQKELGHVHESTFFKRQDGPVILVLAGRSWKTNYLDWKRRIAHVEPADERGRSRWLGEGQFLSFRVCQAIRRILATDSTEPSWSRRATAQIEEVRTECPWASLDSTSLVQHPSGEVHWWTFGGGVANTLLSQHLVPGQNAKADNLSIRFPTSLKLADAEALVGARLTEEIRHTPDEAAIENLKFSECLPRQIAGEVFVARFNEPEALATIRKEPRRVVIES